MVHSTATRHICEKKYAFASYTPVGDDEKVVYLGDSHTTQVLGKGKVVLKFTSRKILALNEVLYVPNIRASLIYVAGYFSQGLFVLDVVEIMSARGSSSTYLIDSYDK